MTYETLYNELGQKYEKLRGQLAGLTATSMRQSEMLAQALKEKNDAVAREAEVRDRMKSYQQDFLTVANENKRLQEELRIADQKLAAANISCWDTLVKETGWKMESPLFIPVPKFKVGQTVLVKQFDGRLCVCTIKEQHWRSEYNVWQYRSENDSIKIEFDEDRIRPLTEEQLR